MLKDKYIFLGFVMFTIIVVLVYKVNRLESIISKTEHFTSVSNEAVQTIGGVYNNGTLTVSNLIVTGDTNLNTLTTAGKSNLVDTNVTGNITTTGNTITQGSGTFGSLISNGTTMSTGKLTVTGGSVFSGDSHYFSDSGSIGKVKIGSVYGLPGISSDGVQLQVQDFTIGTQKASSTNTTGMTPDTNYCYLKSRLPSYGLINNTNTGNFGMSWNNGRMYWTWLSKNARSWNDSIGSLPI